MTTDSKAPQTLGPTLGQPILKLIKLYVFINFRISCVLCVGVSCYEKIHCILFLKHPFINWSQPTKQGVSAKKILAANFDNKYYTTPVSNVLLLYKGIWQLKPGKKNKTGK